MLEKSKVEQLKKLSIRVDALRRAMDVVMNGTSPDHAKWVSFKNYAATYNTLGKQYTALTGEPLDGWNMERMPGSMDSLWPVQKEIFDTTYANTLILSGLLSVYDTGISASISEIQDLLTANLRKVIFTKPDKETSVQDAIESLLVGRGYQKGVNYDREAGKIKFSGKEFIPDFHFQGMNLALEVKLVRQKSDISKAVEEMSADIPAYLSAYSNLLFCVYDLGEIRDVHEFQEGLQKQAGVRICTVKH